MIAALMDDNDKSKKLIDAAKSLATAFSDLLNSLNPNSEDKVDFVLCFAVTEGPKLVLMCQWYQCGRYMAGLK